ncbi:MAG TPA: hypothetical protein VKD26_01375, partial [Streptosporangiaceae bacterium]|nr:hypothetical protein [Streptosporangiaceae bacterium]
APPHARLVRFILTIQADSALIQPRQIGMAVLAALTTLATDAPVLIGIDDVQWLDPDSARALAFALRRLAGARVGTLVTVRDDDPAGSADDLLAVLGGRRLPTVRLDPLPPRELQQVIHAHLGRPAAACTLRRIHTATGGNALWSLEIARMLDGDAQLGADDPVPIPADLRQVLHRRLRQIPDGTLRALLAAASTPHPAVPLLEALLGPDADVAETLAPAVRAGVVRIVDDRVAFGHPLAAEVIRSEAPSPRRRQTHRRLAAVTADPGQRARHLALGADRTDQRLAGELRRAADETAARGATAAAAELYELAAHHDEDCPGRSRDHILAAAAAHSRAGDLSRAIFLLEKVIAAQEPGTARAWVLREIGQLRCHTLATAAALRAYDQAATEAGDDQRLRALLALDRSWAHQIAGDLPAALRGAEVAAAAARRLADRPLLAQTLAASIFLGFAAGRGIPEPDLRCALADVGGGERDRFHVRPSVILAGALSATDRAEQAAALLRADRCRARAAGDETSLALVLAALADLAGRRGDLAEAERLAAEADHTILATGQTTLRAMTLSLRAESHALLGQQARARAEIAEGLALTAQAPALATRLLAAAGHLELSLGNAAAAHAALAPLTAAVASGAGGDPALVRFVADHVEALVILGDLDAAGALLAPFVERARQLQRRCALLAAGRCGALLMTARGHPEPALRDLLEITAIHARPAEPIEYGRCLLAAGRIQRRLRQKKPRSRFWTPR